MNLFNAIGLNTDPFSTSPNVDLFYPAIEHRQCLEGLELAIRMRRGLSVVKGGIGVGKTTISRKLIQNFKDESDDFTFHLILDPKFESEIILLKHIIELFGINDSADSVQDCRNIIENYLLKVGVDQGKTLVLIIDEGQNLPGEMLDVFRTLLNFETDEFKLLQLIIFGQPEVNKTIEKYPNFKDRINFDYNLGPISLEDTKGMIKHRIEVAGKKDYNWFLDESIIKIHKNTQGYPRKITQLCHQALLAMMGENKNIIDEDMVSRVIAGKINHGGLLRQKKKKENKIAVNKLLDVLQKDDQKTEPNFEIDDDDWIGATENKVYVNSNQPENGIKKSSFIHEEKIDSKLAKDHIRDTHQKENSPKRTEKADFSFDQDSIDHDEIYMSLGKQNPKLKSDFFSRLPFYSIYVILNIDYRRIIATAIEKKKGVNTLLCQDIFTSPNFETDYSKNYDLLMIDISKVLELLIKQLEVYGSIYEKAISFLERKNAIALTFDDNQISTHIIQVPTEGAKDKEQIINFSLNKQINFPIEDAVVKSIKGPRNKYYCSVAPKDKLESLGDNLSKNQFDVRTWFPLSQSIYNAYLWNYIDRNYSSAIVLHVGEKNGLILGLKREKLIKINSLYIGLADLFDALIDNGLFDSKDGEAQRKLFQVPKALLSQKVNHINTGKYDDIFRPVFENWNQEIQRTINAFRNELKIDEKTQVLISGSGSDILYLNEYIEIMTGIKTDYLNPVRNLAKVPDFDLKSLKYNSAVLTPSVGAGLPINGSLSILPKVFEQNKLFRLVNQVGISISFITVIFCLILLIQKKISLGAIESSIAPLLESKKELTHVEQKYDKLSEGTKNIREQLKKLAYDSDFSKRAVEINRILSFYTPKEIKISLIKFQNGWETEAYQKIGRDIVPVVDTKDEHLRIVRLQGSVNSNPAYINDHFQNFIGMLEATNLFDTIKIMNQSSNKSSGPEFLQFDLKCIL